jgi:replicative DNA helicase
MNLPNAEKSEQIILHHLLTNNITAKDLILESNSDIFFYDANKVIAEKIISDLFSGTNYDKYSITQYLSNNKYFTDSGGITYLEDLIRGDYDYSVSTHLDILKEKAFHRKYAEESGQIALDIIKNTENIGHRIRDYENRALELSEKFVKRGEGLVKAYSITDSVLNDINTVIDVESKYIGLPTGFQLIDEATLGLHRTDLTIIAARVSCGKSSFFGSVIDNILDSGGVDKTILIFSLEMSKSQLIQRLLSSMSRVPLSNIRRGRMTQFEWARFLYAMDVVSASNIQIDDTPGITLSQIEARISGEFRKTPIDLLVVDYLQLMTPSKITDNRATDIGQLSKGLKRIAKKFNLPLMCLSQLSRAPEKRLDHRPVLSDLRESGSIEADADNVMFLYRDELFNPTTENKGVAEVIIAKQRQGSLGTVPLAFVGQLTKFMNMSV